jgi:hypothetical protein
MLIGDTDSTDVQLTDEEISAMLELEAGALYLTCAACLDSLANKTAVGFTQVKIGSLDLNDKDKVAALRLQAENFRTLDAETPAFAVAEENLSNFNELEIIRNYILRTEL